MAAASDKRPWAQRLLKLRPVDPSRVVRLPRPAPHARSRPVGQQAKLAQLADEGWNG